MHLLPRRRLLTLLLAAASALGVVGTSAGPAAAAYSLECRSSGTSCLTFAGYRGSSTWGYGVNSTGNNCVNYAAFRLARNGMTKPATNLGNGGDWGSRAASMGYAVNATPKPGAIAWWRYGSYYAPSSGHVGYVEEVTSGYIVVSDSSWSGGSKRYRLTPGDPNWPSAFIHFRDVGYLPPLSGHFVRNRETGQSFRMVGRAPVYVSSWTSFGGTQPTVGMASVSQQSLPKKVAEGTFLRGSVRGDHYRVVGGAPVRLTSWTPFGGPRPEVTVDQNALDRAGSATAYSTLGMYATSAYASALDASGRVVNYLLRDGIAYRLSSWSQVGGVKPTVRIDMSAVTHAGQAGGWQHLRAVRNL